MEITIKNCNNIDIAKINIELNKLNIKYAMNGTGKSTIAKVLHLNATDATDLVSLTPFKHRGTKDQDKYLPAIEDANTIKSVKIFNESFINQFVFTEEDLIENSFEIFIKTKEYDDQMKAIESSLYEIKKTFEENQDLKEIIQDLFRLSQCFGKPTKEQSYHGSSAIGKSLGKGNKLANIPKQLQGFSDYLTSKVNVGWINWQVKGNAFLDMSSSCPYCTSPTNDKKELIKSIEKEFDSKTIEHLNILKEIFEDLKKYFSETAQTAFETLFNNTTEISKEGQSFLTSIKSDIDTLHQKLKNLDTISFFSLKDVDQVVETIKSLKIELKLLPNLNSKDTLNIVEGVNNLLDNILQQAGKIQGEINKQKVQIENTIREHKNDINYFLKYAGYRYSIDIIFEDNKYKMKLKHDDSPDFFTDGSNYLSFGERNAFAIILFMYYCLREKPDLIILDDPISSFDRNKKFALVDTLFRKETSFKGKTVLMLTHDLEPVVDMVYTKKDVFGQGTVACFLSSKNGVIQEIPISSRDIVSFSKICDDLTSSGADDIIKLVYLRRLYEVWNEKDLPYQLLSNLLHKRDLPVFKNPNGSERKMTPEEIQEATTLIKTKIINFNYETILFKLKDDKHMLDLFKKEKTNHGKLQLFRIIKQDKHDSSIITKFVNETYHIENEYMMQLHPSKYETIPGFVVEECNKALQL